MRQTKMVRMCTYACSTCKLSLLVYVHLDLIDVVDLLFDDLMLCLIEEAQLGTGSLCSTVMLFYMWKKQTGHVRACARVCKHVCVYVRSCVRLQTYACKQALGPGPAIYFMSLARNPSRHFDLG